MLLCFFPDAGRQSAGTTEFASFDATRSQLNDMTTCFACGRRPISPASTRWRRPSLSVQLPRTGRRRGSRADARGGRRWLFRRSDRSSRRRCSKAPRSSWCRSPAPGSTASTRRALNRLGIPVANVPGGSNGALAEYAVTDRFDAAAALRLGRRRDQARQLRRFPRQLVADNLAGIEGLLVGVVGLGMIGLAVAQAFAKAGCRICYFDPAPADPLAAQAMGAEADAARRTAAQRRRGNVCMCRLLPATTGLIGASQLASMKKDAVLIQASRGGIVDEQALADCLRSGHLGGAAVDVYSTEPPAADNPLLTLDGEAAQRLLLTPHIAGVTRQSSAFLFRTAWENVERVIVKGAPPLYRAN